MPNLDVIIPRGYPKSYPTGQRSCVLLHVTMVTTSTACRDDLVSCDLVLHGLIGRGVRDEDVKVTFSGTCCVYDAFWFRYFCSGRWVHYKTKDIMRERREIVVLCEK